MIAYGYLNRCFVKQFILSGACILMLGAYSGNAAAVPVVRVVDAVLHSSNAGAGPGLDTGIPLLQNQQFTVSVDPGDLWNAGALPRWSNADGLIVDLFATGTDDSGRPAGTHIGTPFSLHFANGLLAPFGSLVGEVGNSFFLLGTSFTGPSPQDGILRLYYWDSNNFDNSEFVTVTIDTMTTVPEPATLALLGAGLLFAGLRRRCRSG